MRHVWVLRHAKAAEQAPGGGGDHGRPLTGRGHRQCEALAAHLAADDGPAAPRPTLVVCSSATRAMETMQGVLPALGQPEVDVSAALYQADADDVMTMLRAVDDAHRSVMVVGHNPTLDDVVHVLHDPDDAAGTAQLERGFPTAALAVLAVAAPTWDALSSHGATLVELFVPARG